MSKFTYLAIKKMTFSECYLAYILSESVVKMQLPF